MPQAFANSRPLHSPGGCGSGNFGRRLYGARRTYSRVRTTTPAASHSARYTESGIPGQTQSGSQRPSHIGMRIRWSQNILRPQLRVWGEVVVLQRRFVLPMTARRYCASAFPSRPDCAAQPDSHASDTPPTRGIPSPAPGCCTTRRLALQRFPLPTAL